MLDSTDSTLAPSLLPASVSSNKRKRSPNSGKNINAKKSLLQKAELNQKESGTLNNNRI